MAKEYCDKKGDHIVRFCHKHGFHDWKTIWDENAKLKEKRSNPLMLFTGDKYHQSDLVSIPKKDQATEKQSMDSEEAYKIPRQKVCLRLRILKGDLQPLADIPFKLKISGGKTYEGNTDASGKVVVSEDDGGPDPEIEKNSKSATLEVTVPQEKAGTENEEAGDDALKADHKLKWNLQIGRLDPVKEKAPDTDCISGVQQRLNNLGFFTGPVDGILGQNTNYAIQSFQSKFDLTIDGDPGQAALQDKLQSVHDTDAAVTKPTGTEPVTATVDKDKFLKTKDKDVGHVAPQFVGGSPNAINTIVVAPEYRLTLELGDINDLFFHKANTPEGKRERLQVAGLYYLPLNHSSKNAATTALWKYYEDVLGGSESDLETKIKEWVVNGGQLPPAAEDPENPAEENFTKIHFPGGYCYTKLESFEDWQGNRDDNHHLRFLVEDIYEAETMCRMDNPVLHAIPIKALVEERYGSTGPWQPAKDKQIYYQLAKPYDLPAYDAAKDPNDQINRPPLRESNMQTDPDTANGVGPKKLVDDALDHNFDADDPRQKNCHTDRGGHRAAGTKVAGTTLELQVDLATWAEKQAGPTNKEKDKRPGFHDKHTGARSGDVEEPFINVPEEAPVSGEKHKHAVRVKSNEEGWSGVIFRPAPMGGDTYRFRVYVGPDTLESDGQDPLAVAVETGTLVIWKNVRVSKTRRIPCTSMAQVMKDEIVSYAVLRGDDAAAPHRADPLEICQKLMAVRKNDGTQVGFSDIDLSPKGDPNCWYDGIIKDFARSFMEMELDPGAGTVEDVTQDEYKTAIEAAIAHAKTVNPNNYDIDKLFLTDWTQIDVSNAFFLLPMRMPHNYNALVANDRKIAVTGGGTGISGSGTMKSWHMQNIVFPMAHSLASDGHLPGLVLIQATSISSWQYFGLIGDYSIGLPSRTTVMVRGKDNFPFSAPQQPSGTAGELKRQITGYVERPLKSKGYMCLGSHEWGHCLFRQHAPPTPTSNQPTLHDPQADGFCVMSYSAAEGQFCGKCLLALSGWDSIDACP